MKEKDLILNKNVVKIIITTIVLLKNILNRVLRDSGPTVCKTQVRGFFCWMLGQVTFSKTLKIFM